MVITTQFTICFWIKINQLPLPPSPALAAYVMLSTGANATGNQIFVNNYGTNNIYLGIQSGDQIFGSAIFTPTDTTSWNHLTFVLNGSTFYQYLNGTQVSTGTYSTSLASTYTHCSLGDYKSGGGQYANCFYDNFCVYNRPLSASEITSIVSYKN